MKRLIISCLLLSASACSRVDNWYSSMARPNNLRAPLISSRTTMVTAWSFPKNPLTDPSLDKSPLSNDVRWGFKIFTNTPQEAPEYVAGKMSCNNCHLNGGQRERSLPLVAVSGVFPEYNKRSGRLYSLEDRVVDCFVRSENATGMKMDGALSLPTPESKEVIAVSAYITWISRGFEVGKNPPWRGKNVIEASKLIPVDRLDRQKGQAIFMDQCANCHGDEGQGVAIGDKKAGPLWGPDSWNDGAGAGRVYTLAGIIRYSMPYLNPGILTDEQAQEVAAFIDSKPRPEYPYKQQDYRGEKRPVDSVYYSNIRKSDGN